MWDPEYDSCDPFQVKRDHMPGSVGSSVGSSANNNNDDLAPGTALVAVPRTNTILASRARRQRESSLVQQLAHTLPLPSLSGSKGRPLDKASILRLAVSYLKVTRILEQFGLNTGYHSGAHAGGAGGAAPNSYSLPRGLEGSFEDALGDGFLIVIEGNGDIVYVSRETLNSLGFQCTEMMGKSIYEWTHPADKADIKHLLLGANQMRNASASASSSSSSKYLACTALIRFKLSVFIAQAEYKVFQVNGKLFHESETGNFFVGMVEPIPHPADNGLPFFVWCSQQIFVTFVSPDMRCMTDAFMRFVHADSQSLNRFLGFTSRERYGRLCYDYIHPEDAQAVTKSVKTVYTKGQSVEYFRFLRRQGGFVQVFTQSTALDANGRITTGNPSVIICRHHVLNVFETGEIIAGIQCPSLDDGDGDGLGLELQSSPQTSESESGSSSLGGDGGGGHLDYPEYLDGLGAVSPHRLETELGLDSIDAMDLIPVDEMYTLDIYLQQHLASFDEKCAEFGYGQLQSTTMMELTSW